VVNGVPSDVSAEFVAVVRPDAPAARGAAAVRARSARADRTHGGDGLPVIRIGKSLRVPRREFAAWLSLRSVA